MPDRSRALFSRAADCDRTGLARTFQDSTNFTQSAERRSRDKGLDRSSITPHADTRKIVAGVAGFSNRSRRRTAREVVGKSVAVRHGNGGVYARRARLLEHVATSVTRIRGEAHILSDLVHILKRNQWRVCLGFMLRIDQLSQAMRKIPKWVSVETAPEICVSERWYRQPRPARLFRVLR